MLGMLLEIGSPDSGRGSRKRRATTMVRCQWKPTAASPSSRRSNCNVTLGPQKGSRNTRSLSECRRQRLAGSCLSNANSGLLVRKPAMQSGRIGCALEIPRNGWLCCANYAACCGLHGLARSLSHPRDISTPKGCHAHPGGPADARNALAA